MPNLAIDITAKFAQFSDALDQMSRKASASAGQIDRAFGALKGTLATLGVGVSVVALKSFVQGSIDAADRLNDLSKKTGIAVETLGGLGFAAQQSGGSLDSMADAAGKLNRSIAEAAAGNKEKVEAFKVLGVSVRDATGNLKSADQVMIELADKFESYADGPNKVALAIKLFGKAGADIIPTLDEGGAKLKANIAYYERYSGVTKDVAEKADQFNDTLTKLSLLSGAVGTKIASELLGPLQKMADRLLEAKENSTLFEKSAEGLKVVFSGLVGIGSGVVFVFEAIGLKLGALAAQAAAVGRMDFKGALTIGREAQADIDAARVSMEKYVQSLFKAKTASESDDAEKFPQAFFGRKRPQAPGLTDTGTASSADAAKREAEEIGKLFSEVQILAGSMDVRMLQISGGFKEAKDQLQQFTKLLQEGKKDWIAYADSVFAEAEAMDRANVSSESFTQWSERVRDRTLENIDSTRGWAKEMRELAELIKVTGTTHLSQMEQKLASLPARLRDLLEPAKTDFQILNEALKEGDISWQKYLETIKRLSPEVKETNDFAKQLGLTFSSAFEDAVIGGKKFRDVLTGIGQDIARILLRKNVTEPLANAIGKFDFGFLKGVFGGGSPDTDMSFATGTDYVPRTGLARVHQGEAIIPAGQNRGGDVNIYQTLNIDSRADQQSIRHGMAIATQQSVAAVEDVNRRRRR